MINAVIVDAVRTPGGKRNGKLKDWHAAELAAHVLKAIQERNHLDPALIDDVIMGCVMQVGEQSLNIGRNAVLTAGWPETVPSTTVDRQCGSSQQALHFAAQGVMSGAYDIVVAAGVEVMTRTPMGASIVKGMGFPFPQPMLDRYAETGLPPQGIGAEMIADEYGLTRQDLDAFGAESQRRAAQATAEGRFDNEIVPVPVTIDGVTTMMTADEGIREGTTAESLANLKPAFKEDGKVTAGNSSQISDGASAVLVMSEERANQLGLRPRARFHRFAVVGTDPVDAEGPDPRHRENPGPLRSVAGRHRPVRGERGLRVRRTRMAEGARHRPDQDQRQRRRDRARPPARQLRHQAHGHPAQRARAHRRPLRHADDVRGRRSRQRHHHREDLSRLRARSAPRAGELGRPRPATEMVTGPAPALRWMLSPRGRGAPRRQRSTRPDA